MLDNEVRDIKKIKISKEDRILHVPDEKKISLKNGTK